jgi:hypothetical protein
MLNYRQDFAPVLFKHTGKRKFPNVCHIVWAHGVDTFFEG